MKPSFRSKASLGVLFLSSSAAFAGGGYGAGNGGDAVVCFDSIATKNSVVSVLKENRKQPLQFRKDPFDDATLAKIRSVELLDLYEARQGDLAREVYHARPVSPAGGIQKSVETALSLLESKNVVLGSVLKNLFAGETLPLRSFKFSPGSVPEVDDSNEMGIQDSRCALIQIAVQTTPDGKPISRRYHDDPYPSAKVTVDRRLFQRMSPVDQSALVLHELLYYFAKTSLLHSNSSWTRKTTALLMSAEFEGMSFLEFGTMIADERGFLKGFILERGNRSPFDLSVQAMVDYLWMNNSRILEETRFKAHQFLNGRTCLVEFKGTPGISLSSFIGSYDLSFDLSSESGTIEVIRRTCDSSEPMNDDQVKDSDTDLHEGRKLEALKLRCSLDAGNCRISRADPL